MSNKQNISPKETNKPKSILDEVQLNTKEIKADHQHIDNPNNLDTKTIEINKSIDEFYDKHSDKNNIKTSKNDLFKKIKLVFDMSHYKLSRKQYIWSIIIIVVCIILLIVVSALIGISIVSPNKLFSF